MNILIIHPSFQVFGGAEDIVARLSNYLDSKGHVVSIWTSVPGGLRQYLQKNINIIPGDFKGYDMDQFDIINPHNHPAVLRSLYWINNGIPVIHHFNEPSEHVLQGYPPTDKEVEVANRVNRIVVWSQYNKDRTMKLYGVTPDLVYLGIDYRYYNTKVPDAKKKLRLEDKYVILAPGWFNPYKNQLKSIEVLANLVKSIPNIKMVFTGFNQTPYANGVKKAIDRLNIHDYVSIESFWDREKMRMYYNASDVVLMPYLQQGGFISIFEAIVTGTPIVLGEYSCASFEVKKNKLGLVSNDYINTILKIHKYPEWYWSIINYKRARKWIRIHINWEVYCSSMLRIFEEEVDKHG